MPTKNRTADQLLKDVFAAKHVDAAVRHFGHIVEDFQSGDWEDSATKGGKFIEAALKALWVHVGETVPGGKDFKAGNIMDQLAARKAYPDSIRLTIPRACKFAYEIASNRGARHDATEIDANEMDATAVLSVCVWILCEMIRYSQKNSDLAEATKVVAGLMKKRFPFFEEIDGRHYTDIGTSAREVALLILRRVYPSRMGLAELVGSIERHGYSKKNAVVAVQRVGKLVDTDADGAMKLRQIGVAAANELISRVSHP